MMHNRNMIKQQQRMLLEFAGFGLLLIVVVNLIVRVAC